MKSGACLLLLLATLVPWSEVRALEDLPPETLAAFNRSVHDYFGCEDCHISGLPDRIPRQKTPAICGDCHPKAYKAYLTSVHWQNGHAETICTDCHGSHDITPVKRPGSKAYRSLVCGTCHLGSREHFNRSPHKAGLEKTGALACAACHSNHAVQRLDRMETACAACHPDGTSARQMGRRTQTLLAALRDTLAQTEVEIARAEAGGLRVKRPRQTLQEARAGLLNARLVWHSLQEKTIGVAAEQSARTAQQARTQLAGGLSSRRLRRIGLGIAWGVILLNVLLIFLKRKRLE